MSGKGAKSSTTAAVTQSGPLSGKDASLYRDILKLYDEKNFRKAIRTADNLLERRPGHAETLGMKGLATFYLGRKEEGYALVKQGLVADMK